jgi:hypothetical protein
VLQPTAPISLKLKQNDDLYRWLQPFPSEERLHELLRMRSVGTGDWVLHLPKFEVWLTSRSGLLWIHAPPGYGKSSLSAFIIAHLRTQLVSDQRLAYYFFDYSDPRTTASVRMLAALLYQLRPVPIDISSSLYSAHVCARQSGQQTISESAATDCFMDLIQAPNECTTLILDGLDESPESSSIAGLLLRMTQHPSNPRILVLSRDTPELVAAFTGHQDIGMDKAMTKPDIDSYLQTEIRALGLQSGTNEENETIQKLQAQADGSFLWARIMISRLKSAISPAHVSEILESSADCDGLFDKSLRQLASLPPRQRELVQKTIYWVCCAKRPLTLQELSSAIAIQRDANVFDVKHRPFLQTLKSLISALFITGEVSDPVKPLHASLMEHLTSELRAKDFYRAETAYFFVRKSARDGDIALNSITLIRTVLITKDWMASIDQEPLFSYCAIFWLDHLLASPRTDNACERVHDFLDSPCRQRWLFYWLLNQRQVFPLRKILHLQQQLCKWLGTPSTETSISYLNWDYDICNALADIFARDESGTPVCNNFKHPGGRAEIYPII